MRGSSPRLVTGTGKACSATPRLRLALLVKNIYFFNSTHHSLGGIQKALCLRLGIKCGEDRNRHCLKEHAVVEELCPVGMG